MIAIRFTIIIAIRFSITNSNLIRNYKLQSDLQLYAAIRFAIIINNIPIRNYNSQSDKQIVFVIRFAIIICNHVCKPIRCVKIIVVYLYRASGRNDRCVPL